MAIAQADADPKMLYLNLKSCSKCCHETPGRERAELLVVKTYLKF